MREKLKLALYLVTIGCWLTAISYCFYFHFAHWDELLTPKQKFQLMPIWPGVLTILGWLTHLLNQRLR